MTDLPDHQDYALAIRALDQNSSAPVVYDLNADSIEIGSDESNHIVLNGPGVEPFHLALRRVAGVLMIMVDRSIASHQGQLEWMSLRDGDRLLCSSHGEIDRTDEIDQCPLCKYHSSPLWLVRPLHAGDVFPIGEGFEGAVMSQRRPKQISDDILTSPAAPWPDRAWLENPPQRYGTYVVDIQDEAETRPYPFDNSNFWTWTPVESPLPVFLHQKANRYVARHAYRNSNREIGGVLLGHVYKDPFDGFSYPVITDALAARFATEARGHLTFTRETWLDISYQREEHFPDTQIVGWYHTHPGLDVFLSQLDLFIHRNFFSQPWQVALVVDPRQDIAGFFVWDGDDLLDPQTPYGLFKMADPGEDTYGGHRSKVRIKLGERVE